MREEMQREKDLRPRGSLGLAGLVDCPASQGFSVAVGWLFWFYKRCLLCRAEELPGDLSDGHHSQSHRFVQKCRMLSMVELCLSLSLSLCLFLCFFLSLFIYFLFSFFL